MRTTGGESQVQGSPIRPELRIDRVHIRSLKGLLSLELPEDGLGWSGRIPSTVLIGGANGSGKTALLEYIALAAHFLGTKPIDWLRHIEVAECLLDFFITDGSTPSRQLRFLAGEPDFVKKNTTENCFGYTKAGNGFRHFHEGWIRQLRRTLVSDTRFRDSAWPRCVFIPSRDRDLVIPNVTQMVPGGVFDYAGFVYWWKRPNKMARYGTTLELFASAQRADSSTTDSGHFERFTAGLREMTGGRKELGWTSHGELIVKLREGGTHPVSALSAGERSIVLLLAELSRSWRPGSLILIDDLELHLHDAWQGKLYEMLLAMRQELGGQLIITTQSHSFFEMAESGTQALLGRGALR